MVIKGRTPGMIFHLVDSEEYFYQLKGDIKVRIAKAIASSIISCVKERRSSFRPTSACAGAAAGYRGGGSRASPAAGEHEHVIFYCDNCGALVEDIDFDCGDIVEHFSQAMLDFWNE